MTVLPGAVGTSPLPLAKTACPRLAGTQPGARCPPPSDFFGLFLGKQLPRWGAYCFATAEEQRRMCLALSRGEQLRADLHRSVRHRHEESRPCAPHTPCPPLGTHQSMMLVDNAAENPRTLKLISVAVHSARPPMTGTRDRLTSSPEKECGQSV